MATLRITTLKTRKTAEGKFPILIAVSHHGDTRYITTEIVINDLSEFENGKIAYKKDANILNKRLDYILNEYKDILKCIPDTTIYNCVQIKEILINTHKQSKMVTVKEWFEKRIHDFEKEGRLSYASMNRYTLDKILAILGNITLQSISVSSIYKFKNGIKDLANATQQMRLTQFKARINEAINEHMVKYDEHPFKGTTMPRSTPKLLDITIDEFRKILNYQTEWKTKKLAKDIFLLSFYLGGINLADLVKVTFDKDYIEYERQKTVLSKEGNKIIRFSIPEQAKPIIAKYKGKNGKLDFGYKFSYSNFQRYLNARLKGLAKETNIDEKHFSYYSARKTFSQFAFELGVKTEVIEYCIGQSMKENRPIFNYVRVMQRTADAAIRRVIDYTEHPEKYDDIISMCIA